MYLYFSLSSDEYHRRLDEHQSRFLAANINKSRGGHQSGSSKSPGVADASPIPASLSPSVSMSDESIRLEELLRSEEGNEIRYKITADDLLPRAIESDESQKFICKVYFASQFSALRKAYLGDETLYLESLSRCNAIDAGGGKSKASFCRTADKKFIAKTVSQREFDMFLSNARQYFSYMSAVLFHELPTVLMKILGVYQVCS